LGSQGPIHRQRTTAAASWSEAPSAGRSIPTASTCVKSCRMGRHWSLGLAASVQLPACVHPRASELGPTPEPVIHRSAKGHMPPDDFYNDVDAGARPPKLRPRPHGEPCVRVTGPCGAGQPHTRSSGVERARSSHHTLDGACFTPPRIFPDLFVARTPVVARQHRSPRGRREDQRFNSSALLLAEPRTNPPWWGDCNRRTQGRHDEPGGTLACDAPCLGPPNEGELAKASSADRIRGVFHSRTRCPTPPPKRW
jgi:hypothetical protein